MQLTWLAAAAVTAAAVAVPAIAHAQQADDFEAPDIEVPVIIVFDEDVRADDRGTDLDLANIVTSAAKRVTTLQEAPAIVSVITAEQIRQRHFQNLEQAVDSLPGWLRFGANYNQFPYILSRGTMQAVLLLRDGVSQFEPMLNTASLGRTGVQLETVKRIEVITGPGGVLWGANSFLGLINVISKGASDVDGVEASAGYGSGPGNMNNLRGYVMTGIEDAAIDGVDVFAHVGFDAFENPHYGMPSFLYHSPQPQPNSLTLYGPLDDAEPARSLAVLVDGSVTAGPFRLFGQWADVAENKSLTFAGGVVNEDLPEDERPECQGEPDGPIDAPPCIDRGRVGRKNTFDFYDRFVALEWKDRVGKSKHGIQARAYASQFVRRWEPLLALVPVAGVLPGGLGFRVDNTSYRAGATVDGDLTFGKRTTLLYGVEAFREWLPDRTERATGGPGTEATFTSPYNLNLLPLPCPKTARWDEGLGEPVDIELVEGCPLLFANRTNRTVVGAYSSLQYRPTEKLILDGGVRLQAAPGAFSTRPYDPQLLGSGALVYELVDDWHVKLNLTQGFRPPVFNNTDINGAAVAIGGEPELEPERSQAVQAELNARIRGSRRIREYVFRADYSYTVLDNLISFPEGRYENGGRRGIHSAELLATMRFTGEHRFDVAYTWMRAISEDLGILRTVPEHWFNVGLVSRFGEHLESTIGLRVLSAFEDPNRLVEYRDLEFGAGGGISPDPAAGQSVAVQPYEVVVDRVPPGPELVLGLRSLLMDGALELSLTVYNAFDAQNYQPDPTSSFSPRLEILPNPYARFHAMSTLSYRH